jgi:hypothetical protein
MSDSKANTFDVEVWGTRVDMWGSWLSGHAFLVIMLFCVIIFAITLCKHYRRDAAKNVAPVLKAIGSTASVITSFSLLLPFVARAFWGTISGNLPTLPKCLSEIATACNGEMTTHLATLTRHTVPATTPLGIAVLSAFLAAVVWFVGTMKDTFKKSEETSRPEEKPTAELG